MWNMKSPGLAIIVAVAASGLMPLSAEADFLFHDLSPGDRSLIFDTSTGLDWLRLDATYNVGVGQILNPGSSIPYVNSLGFRFATTTEVNNLYSTLHIDTGPFSLAQVIANYPGGVELLTHWGCGTCKFVPDGAGNLSGPLSAGFALNSTGPNQYSSHVVNVGFFTDPISRWQAQAHIGCCEGNSDTGVLFEGSFLVRTGDPVPSAPGLYWSEASDAGDKNTPQIITGNGNLWGVSGEVGGTGDPVDVFAFGFHPATPGAAPFEATVALGVSDVLLTLFNETDPTTPIASGMTCSRSAPAILMSWLH